MCRLPLPRAAESQLQAIAYLANENTINLLDTPWPVAWHSLTTGHFVDPSCQPVYNCRNGTDLSLIAHWFAKSYPCIEVDIMSTSMQVVCSAFVMAQLEFAFESVDRRRVLELWTPDEIYNEVDGDSLPHFYEDNRVERKPAGMHADAMATIAGFAKAPGLRPALARFAIGNLSPKVGGLFRSQD